MEEVVLRLDEVLFPAIADVAVLSVDVEDEAVRIEARSTVVRHLSRVRKLVTADSQLLPGLSC
ncbi:hypothetical protein OG379_40295 (plasmid) [Streptomyces sp. NBC_01166]|uniref:hypothetical protein n=1 Tax=Streptomyces sp. NBC_01166 TaxID=2903755 RepID=UPI00386DB1E9|nr:hypothetical protein OG379_40295 [Streptomyces sp. NBC_01166]